jgi:hypothetical protein
LIQVISRLKIAHSIPGIFPFGYQIFPRIGAGLSFYDPIGHAHSFSGSNFEIKLLEISTSFREVSSHAFKLKLYLATIVLETCKN